MNAAVKEMQGRLPLRLLHEGTHIQELLWQLERHPELWDQNRFRTRGGYGNPHSRLSDILVRYNDWATWTGDRRVFNERHESVWWAAYEKLPAIRPLVFDLMRLFEAEQLGMVLITRIPAHTVCERHVDVGWHAGFYTKFALSIKANQEQKFCFDDCHLVSKPGDLWTFDNSKAHWVENHSDQDRITLIMCLRTKQPTSMNCAWQGEE